MTKILTILLCLFSPCFGAMGEQPAPIDPVARIRYTDAFDQQEIYTQFSDLMQRLWCSDNVSLEVDLLPEFTRRQTLADFHAACLKKLQRERSYTILEPAIDSASMIVMMGVALVALMSVSGSDSFGGSFGLFAFFFNCVPYFKEMMRSSRNWYHPPAHPVDRLEIQFAKSKCFIPNALWDKITTRFMNTRQNPFSQENAINFLSFSTGMTLYAPKKALRLQGTLRSKKERIDSQIREFFNDYESFKDPLQLPKIIISVQNFLETLLGNPKESRYILLTGPGGIGKTHFANLVARLINEAVPNAVTLEKIVVTTPEDLEGTTERPGAFVRILRNQCLYKKHGSIVLFDEANWLNEKTFEATAKRVFNKPGEGLSSSYFGEGLDGTGVKLPMPPCLVFVALNHAIEEEALLSRFSAIDFPMPRMEAIDRRAYDLGLPEGTTITAKTFREVEDMVPPVLYLRNSEN